MHFKYNNQIKLYKNITIICIINYLVKLLKLSYKTVVLNLHCLKPTNQNLEKFNEV